MNKNNIEKQKKVFLLALVFIILLFSIFVTAAIKFVNSNTDKAKFSTKTAASTASISKSKVESSTIESNTLESSTISISTESAKDNAEKKNTNEEDNKALEQNTNEGKEVVNTGKMQQSNSKENIDSNNSLNTSENKPSTEKTNEEANKQEENKQEESKQEESPKFIVNINVKIVDNTIFSSQLVLEEEMNAFDALKYYCEKNSIELGYTGSGQFSYVTSINGVKEKSEGPSSGWMYKVNGVFPNVSSGKYNLSSNDTLEWVFTKDGGKDVGAR